MILDLFWFERYFSSDGTKKAPNKSISGGHVLHEF